MTETNDQISVALDTTPVEMLLIWNSAYQLPVA